MRILAVAALCLATGACSSITEGTSQNLSFNSVPEGADCSLVREGTVIGTVRTPGEIRVQKTKHDLELLCEKDGFEDAKAHLTSDTAAATFGNILMGGGIGWAIDSASGADNKYDDVTTVVLEPLPADTASEAAVPAGKSAPQPEAPEGGVTGTSAPTS